MKHLTRFVFTLVAVCALAIPAVAQVTTGSLNGVVQNEQQQGVSGANVIAIHLPSGTAYETTTRADGFNWSRTNVCTEAGVMPLYRAKSACT